MPNGILIMHWDERIGAEIVAKTPAEADIEERTLMQVYAQHEYSGDAGFISLTVGMTNLTSYYTGPDTQIYIILLLTMEEDGFDYEQIMIDVSRQVIALMESPQRLQDLLPAYFQRICAYPSLSDEQKLGLFLQDEIKRMIFQRFREEVAIPRSELEIWLKDQYRSAVAFDMDGIINNMLKMGLIKFVSVKGSANDMIFFIQDIMCLRHPPRELVRNPVAHHLPRSLRKAYITEVRNYFADYKVSEEDNLNVINQVLLDPAIYEVLKLMRVALVTRNDLEKLKKKGVDDVNYVLKTLWELKMITVLQDESETEYYGLISDFYLERYFPAYNLDTIVEQYKHKSQDEKVLLKALDIMREEFWLQNPKSKEKKISAKAES